MIPRVLLALLLSSGLAYFLIWCVKHEDRVFIRKLLGRIALAVLIGAVMTVGIIHIDVLTN
jgi:hypothetical protein